MKRYAIIVAGGTGSRMNSELPKQFLMLNGKPLLMHSIEAFAHCNCEIIVVMHKDYIDYWKQTVIEHQFNIQHIVAEGGTLRCESVQNGLNNISDEGLVAIHDAARPIITPALIEKLFDEAQQKGNAVPFLRIAESMRQIFPDNNKPVNRSEFVTIQTPQCFQTNIIQNAYSAITDRSFTDDATLAENFGVKINLVEGDRNNFKITTADDLKLAEALIGIL